MQHSTESQIASLVIAGGMATRMGGVDKSLLPLGRNGGLLLTEVIEACPGKVIVVGKPRDINVAVTWVADLVEAGGPAAGIWAGLSEIDSEYVFITAGDQQLTSQIAKQICQAAVGQDGAWAIRPDGQGQPLLACVKSDLIRNLLAETQGVNASPLRLMQELNMVDVKVNGDDIKDVDTWADVASLIKEQEMSDVTPIWLTQVASLLGIPESEIPVNELLDLTREVAHNVERKSAPLTTYLIGLAAGKTGTVPQDLIDRVNAAVTDWTTNE